MVRKIFFGVTLFVLSVLLANPVSAAEVDIDYSAELDKVCKPSHCVVPVPTLVDPNEKIIKIDENFYLIGLTWNNTKIDIYVDNEYQGKAIVVNDDDSDTANFYYLVENHLLLEGQHEWKVIAWTENMRKRSYISVENKFIIEDYFIAPHLNNITSDIDGNNWLIGSAENNSLVSIYVDNVYKGQVRTDGNFNYNIGPLSPGLHTFYALTKEVDTNKTSKRSNILSEQVMETQIIAEEVIEEEPVLEPEEEVIPEPIEEELIEPEVIEEEPILEPEEVEITEEAAEVTEEAVMTEEATEEMVEEAVAE